ncbi:protein KASH5-like [Strix uralensis]|uniref:protein KASH5-like n=1 Tax=Strix uralensis TaxID=36305 RepID=UPI003DA322A4
MAQPFPSPASTAPGDCARSWSPATGRGRGWLYPHCAAGLVLAGQVVEYLQALTGQSGEEGRLQALHRMLDPEAAGAALDLPTFHAVMRKWIASCQQEGGSQLAEEWDVASGDLGLVITAPGRS